MTYEEFSGTDEGKVLCQGVPAEGRGEGEAGVSDGVRTDGMEAAQRKASQAQQRKRERLTQRKGYAGRSRERKVDIGDD